MKPVEILLVEDNAGDILLIQQALAREPFPISVHVAVDGKQAIQMLSDRHFRPDLVILDLSLPRMPGMAVLERTRHEIPVVVFTTSPDPADRRCAFELGAKEYIQKPSDLTEYGTLVSQMVRHWGMPKRSCA